MNPNKIGKFIFKLRTENHLSQYQLADKIPISRQAVSKWERGQTIPDSSTLIRLSEIFDVTINELLNGERKEINTIKELEKTTLSIVDENNKKTKVVRILLDTFIVTIFILIICFFIYYFINSYKTIKVYMINGKGKEFDIYDGVLLVTKQKSYLKLGKIQNRNNHEIESVRLYIKVKDKEINIFEDKDIDKTIIDIYGYDENILIENQKELINESYVLIYYDNQEIETIKLEYRQDFMNDNYLFSKKDYIKTSVIDKPEEKIVQNDQKAIHIIKSSGKIVNNSYILTISEEDQIIYSEDLDEIIMKKNNEIVWYILLNNNYYHCSDESLYIEKCHEQIKKDISKYVLE